MISDNAGRLCHRTAIVVSLSIIVALLVYPFDPGLPTRFLFLLFFFPPSIPRMMSTIINASPAMRPSSLPSPPNHNRIWEFGSPSILTLVGRVTNFGRPSHRHLVVVAANVSTALDGGGGVPSLGSHGDRFRQKAKLPTEIFPFGHHGEETGWVLSFSAAAGGRKRN